MLAGHLLGVYTARKPSKTTRRAQSTIRLTFSTRAPMTPVDFSAAQQTMGITRAEMALAMGVHYETLAKWQRGTQAPPAAAITLVNLLLWLHDSGQLPRWMARQTKEISP